jgi:hypothetical protein
MNQTILGKCLLIDAATPLIQAVIFDGAKVLSAEAVLANAVDAVSTLAKKLMAGTATSFDDLHSMAYCGGPGSAMGLRTVLISMKIWTIFSSKKPELVEYSSLDMCLHLNRGAGGVCANVAGEDLIMKRRNGQNAVISNCCGENFSPERVVFLNTRRTKNEKFAKIPPANYCIAGGEFPLQFAFNPSSGDLKDYGSIFYKKWDGLSIAEK